MQSVQSQSSSKKSSTSVRVPQSIAKPLMVGTLLALSLSLSGCQAIRNLTSDDTSALATASQTEASYYNEALQALNDGDYLDASSLLTELRTFYPTGRFAEQALLDLMYSQFQSKEFELAAGNADLFINLYPNNTQVDYAYYVRGVANMQIGTNTLLNVVKQDLAHRDTAYMRLAFTNFQELLNRFPTSPYVPDAAQRMSFIYNQFAEGEMTAARWYLKREAYVAAANRAKWVFQYYPLSQQTPEAIATLAYSYEQLGINDLAQEYKTLLQLNYPQWLTANGEVRLDNRANGSILNTLTFGVLGRSADTTQYEGTINYQGETRTQTLERAALLQLPASSADTMPANVPNTAPVRRRNNLNIGLGLPESDTERVSSQNSSAQVANDSMVRPDMVNPTRRTTLPTDARHLANTGAQPQRPVANSMGTPTESEVTIGKQNETINMLPATTPSDLPRSAPTNILPPPVINTPTIINPNINNDAVIDPTRTPPRPVGSTTPVLVP